MPTPDVVAGWFKHALGDLRTARAIVADEALPPRWAVFLAQQAAEKALKASIASSGPEPPWIDDLVRLRSLAPEPISVGTSSIALVALSVAVTAARCPDPDEPPYEHAEAARLVADAGRLVDIVAGYLRSEGFVVSDMPPE